MSPSTSGIGVSLGTEDFDVGVGGRHGPRDQRGAWLEAAVCCEGVGGEGRWAASRMTVRERGGDFDVNMVPNDSAKPKFFSQRDCQLTHGFHSEPVDAASTAGGGGAGMTGGGLAGECLGHAECRNGSADPQINISAAATQELPSSWHVKTLITQGLVAPSVASKDDPKPIVSRTEQDQRTRSTVAMSLTRLGLPEPPSAGRAKAQVCKTFSGNVAANPLLGIFGTTTPGRSPPPAGRLTSAAAAAARTPPRPWEVRVLLLALLLAASVNGRYDRGGLQHTITWGRGNSHSSAVFGNGPTNVTAVLGHRASLPCQVKNLGPKDVSWIRQRDLHILTVGIFTYTSDDRFKVFHPEETEDWFLEISSVTFRDSGVYECQVSTSPKVSLPIHLTVLAVQQAEIPGPHEVFIQHGSTISLQCEVRAGVEAVGLVRWYHGDKPLNYSSPRGGISMEVEKTPTMTTSKLYITRAVKADTGNYTCAPKFSCPDSVFVHVVNAGEESAAAVQSGSRGVRAGVGVLWVCMLVAAALTPTPLIAPRRRRL
ncbi:uncharacterized protein LOC135107969 [Scylla paramamosain]|uniref:uncharacterized protein LOC135107969 n=1 Tax=Scylla paramamosain TaxID=85552 RepID=UPI0030835DDB